MTDIEKKEWAQNRLKAIPFLLIGPFMCFAPNASDAERWFALVPTLAASISIILEAFASADIQIRPRKP